MPGLEPGIQAEARDWDAERIEPAPVVWTDFRER